MNEQNAIGFYKIRRKYDGLFSNGTRNCKSHPLKFTKYGRTFKSLRGIKEHISCAISNHAFYNIGCCIVQIKENGYDYVGDIVVNAIIEKDKLNPHLYEHWSNNKYESLYGNL